MQVSRAGAGGEGPGLTIRLLGGFELRLGDARVPAEAFPRRKALALVKLLALAPDHALSRETVIAALWPSLEPDRAVAQLQNAASQARRALRAAAAGASGQAWIVLSGGQVALRAPGGVETDLQAFALLAARALETRARCDLREAASAYTGTLLPSDLYEDWCDDERSRTVEAAASVWSELGRRSLADGLPDEAVEAFERVIALQPEDLQAHRALLRLAAAAGNAFAFERRVDNLRRVFREELDAPLPASLVEDIEALRESVGRPRTESSGPVPLPVPSTPLVGRWGDLARLLRQLHTGDCRLVTVTGVGGVGKTRLALEAARWWSAAGGRAAYVSLESAGDDATVLARTAAALGLPPTSGTTEQRRDAIARALAGQGFLLVLDNFEHLMDAASEVERLIVRADDARCLVTSRHRLGVAGEWLFELRGLPVTRQAVVSDSLAGASAAVPGGPAVDLFLACARRVVPALSFDEEAVEAAREICLAVEGLPLAVELAAGWLRVVTPQALLSEIREGGLPVGDPSSDGPTAIVDVFQRSWRRLSPERQRIYLELSVFRGGFSRELARDVAGATTADLLAFVDASLVQREDDERFRPHEILRQLAARRLEQEGRTEQVRRRHADTMLTVAETLEHEMRGPFQGRWMERASRERDNLEAALAWSRDARDAGRLVRLTAALAPWWERLGELDTGLAWLGRALERATPAQGVPPGDRARVLLGLGVLERHRGAWEVAARHLAEAERLAGAVRPLTAVYARHQLAVLERYRGRAVEARALQRDCLDAFRNAGDTVGQYLALFHLAELERRLGNPQEAEGLQIEALERARERGDASTIASSLYRLGRHALDRGDAEGARRRLRESLAVRRSLGDRIGVLASLGALAGAYRDDCERAAELLAAADAGREVLVLRLPADEEASLRRTRARLRAALGADAYRGAASRGRDRSFESVLDDALAGAAER